MPIEVAQRGTSSDEEWLPDEVELNSVKIGNMSIKIGKVVETDGKRGRYREITVDTRAGESPTNDQMIWDHWL